MTICLLSLALLIAPPPVLDVQDGDTITIVGGTFAERMQHFPWFEAGLREAYPELDVHVRNFGWSADEVGLQPRPYKFAGMDAHVQRVGTNVLIAAFGMNESYASDEGLDEFKQKLQAWLDHHESLQVDGEMMDIVLVSPIAHEDIGGRLPNGQAHTFDIERYTDVIRREASARDIPFVDLHRPLRTAMRGSQDLTINGIHLNSEGHRVAAREMLVRLGVDPSGLNSVTPEMLDVLRDKNRLVFERYRPINTEYVYGRRHEPYGDDNFPEEMKRLESLAQAADARLHAGQWRIVQPDPWEGFVPEVKAREDGAVPPEDRTVPHPNEQIDNFTLPDGWSINCFASEADFPQLANPIAMNWDGAGRLWVIVAPTYPHVMPGVLPDDKLIVLEDTDRDGRADELTVFADGLYVPTGFATNGDEAWVVSQPNLLHIVDTDGDGVGDERTIVLHGFGSEDSHHAMSAFARPPDGSIYFQEGVFHNTQIESPQGPERLKDAGVMRYDPETGEVEGVASWPFANPWGHVFDRWGRSIITDGTNGLARRLSHISGPHPYPDPGKGHGDVRGVKSFTPSGRRPAGGTEILGGGHVPDELEGWLVQPQNIGFHGVRWYELQDDASGFKATSQSQDLLSSSDQTCRPVDLEIGPDGALYVLDWANPIVGHMQFNVRDPRRDHSHGRVWRITRDDAPLVEWSPIDDQNTPEVLTRLAGNHPWAVRRARIELQRRPADEVLPEAIAWANAQGTELAMLEALWLHQAHGVVHEALLDDVLASEDGRVRAAAVAVLRDWRDELEVFDRLKAAVLDTDPDVRMEAVLALGYVQDPKSVELVSLAMRQPIDNGTTAVLRRALVALEPLGTPGGPGTEAWRLSKLDDDELMAEPLDFFSAGERLKRASLSLGDRLAAAQWIAQRSGRSVAAEVWNASNDVDGDASADLLMHLSHEDLMAVQPAAVAALEAGGGSDALRHAAWAVMARTQSWNAAWDRASSQRGNQGQIDLLGAAARWPELAGGPETYGNLRMFVGSPPEEVAQPMTARRVRVELDGPATLTLAEVEVFSKGRNVALGKPCTQSSLGHGGTPERAVDGDANGDWMAGKSTHTIENKLDPWWEVDLGEEVSIDRIVIHNRTNRPHHQRLDGYRIVGIDDAGQRGWLLENQPAPTFSTEVIPGVDPDWPVKLETLVMLPRISPTEEMLRYLAGWYDAVEDDATRLRIARAMADVPEDQWPDDLSSKRLKRVRISTVPDKMLYDIRKVEVFAGQPVELKLVNEDRMPHNLVVGRPGSLRQIGRAADAQGMTGDALTRNYVPDVKGILHASPLVAEGTIEYLRFIAPDRPGRYPYVCTYPGHWQMMNGVMSVKRPE